MKVEIVNKTNKIIYEEELIVLMGCAEKVLRLPREVCVNIFFVGESEIKKLNHETRGINKITDVLSFPIQDKNNYVKDVEDNVVLGDIVICPSYAMANVAKQGREVEKELNFLVLHGMLHLCGYDHNSDKEQVKMDKAGEEIIDFFVKL